MKIDKTKLKDDMGRPLTQGLFLEVDYNADRAIYTLKEQRMQVRLEDELSADIKRMSDYQ